MPRLFTAAIALCLAATAAIAEPDTLSRTIPVEYRTSMDLCVPYAIAICEARGIAPDLCAAKAFEVCTDLMIGEPGRRELVLDQHGKSRPVASQSTPLLPIQK